MKNYRVNSLAKQRGMTLIELTVVLLILIGLAGLLLPYVGGFNEKTQNSSAADSLSEVSRAIHRYDAQFMAYPDAFDSLVDTAGNLITYLPDDLPASTVTTCIVGDGTTPGEDQLDSLHKAEIDSLFPMFESTVANFNATFNSVATTGIGTNNATVLANNSEVACLERAAIATILVNKMGVEVDNRDTDAVTTNDQNDYYVFGVGQRSQMTGKTISEAPVYFSGENPTSTYARFLAVFKVSKNGSQRAQYLGALSPDMKTVADFQQAHFASIEDQD